MPILVNEIRLSLIWTKSFYKDFHLPAISSPDIYAAEFDQAGRRWHLPWLPNRAQHFWQYFLNPASPGSFKDVSAENARSFFVPLRMPSPADVTSQDGTGITFEGFCYPYSTAAVATLRLRPLSAISLAEAATLAIQCRNAEYLLTPTNQGPPSRGLLENLAEKIIGAVHAQAEIEPGALGLPLGEPITIATVVDAEGVEKSDPTLLADMLRALLTLSPHWRTMNVQIPSSAADSEIPQLLGAGRGRALWNPKHFSSVGARERRTANGCYHRNLTLATMQTSALTALLQRAEEILADPKGQFLEVRRKDVAKAIKMLRSLSAGDSTTYRSWGMKYQINFAEDHIQAVAPEFD